MARRNIIPLTGRFVDPSRATNKDTAFRVCDLGTNDEMVGLVGQLQYRGSLEAVPPTPGSVCL